MKPRKRDKALTDTYRMENPLCELWDVLEGENWRRILHAYTRGLPAIREDFEVVVHHIWGGPHRWDILPNIIAVSQPAHDFCHKYPDLGRVACMWAKADKGEFSREGRTLMRECMGFDAVGIMESFCVTEEWVEDMRLDLNERFSSYERS